LTNLCEELAAKKAELEEAKAQTKQKQEAYDEVEFKLLQIFEASSLNSFDSPVGKIVRMGRVSVAQPSTPEDKEKFFAYLKSKGDFENLISVNSKTLSAYVKREFEVAEESGKFDFTIPGIGAPSKHYYLALRKK
jgi:ABC-type hemin transport system ATPase subunit